MFALKDNEGQDASNNQNPNKNDFKKLINNF